LMALVEESVRNGCTYLRLDLASVTAIDVVGLRMLRRFQVTMHGIGVTLRFSDPQRRTTQLGLMSFQVAGPAVLA
jgi:anti-anti-sigma regulatory factor